jgi:hypothetical protein
VIDGQRLLEVPAGGGAQKTIATGQFSFLALDGAGNLFTVTSGDLNLLEFPAGGGAPIAITIPDAFLFIISNGNPFIGEPGGMAADSAGNLFVTNFRAGVFPGSVQVLTYQRSLQPPPLSFATAIVGHTSADSPHTVSIANMGNQNLAFSAIGFAAGVNFARMPGSGSPADCSAGTPLTPTNTCNLSISFIPAVAGNLTDALTLTDNALNGNPSTQSIPLSGIGVTIQPTTTALTANTAHSSYGQPVTLTATVTAPVGTPFGTVTFLTGTTVIGSAALDSSGKGSLTLATIPVGNNSITASYPMTLNFLASTSAAVTVTVASNNVHFGATNVCAPGETKPTPCSQTMNVTYNVIANTTLGTPKVVTQGIPNLDYTLSSTTCTGVVIAGSTCTVSVKFVPRFAGSRAGAVQIVDGGGNVLQTFFLAGVGTSAQVAFNGAVPVPVPNSPSGDTAVVVDAAGNLFMPDDSNSGQIIKLPAGGGPSIQLTNNLSLLFGGPIAVDGAGNLFVVNAPDVDTTGVVEVPAGGGQAITILAGGAYDLAVDAKGNLFVVDFSGKVVEVPAGGGAPIPILSGSFASHVAVDAAGNVFVVDLDPATFLIRIEMIPAGGGAPETVVNNGALVSPLGLAVDAADDLFVVDNGTLTEFPAGNRSPVVLESGLPSSGLSLDGAGNVFIADPFLGLSRIERSQPPALTFAATIVKTTSSPQSVQIQNTGNASLIVTQLKVDENFDQTAGPGAPPDCTGTSKLAAGAICNLSISFTPDAIGTLNGTAVLTDNALKAAGAMQSIALSGVGAPKNTTTTTLVSSLNPSMYGQAVTFTARVTAASGPTPTGTVTFERGRVLGSATLINGVATFTTSALPAGSPETITAEYNGTASDAGSGAVLSQTVQKSTTTTTLTSSLNPSIAGQAVTFTATVAAASGPKPTGAVNFKRGGTLFGRAEVKNGIATLTTSEMPAGNPNNITAEYSGDSSDAPSTSAVLAQVVHQYSTTTALASSRNPSVVEQAVKLTATVTAAAGPPPTGTVIFKNGGTSLGSATLSNGVATFTTSELPAGNDNLTAVYTGNEAFAGSTSAVLPQTVH